MVSAATLVSLVALFTPALGAFVVTTPRQWYGGEDVQVCVHVPSPAAPVGTLSVTLNTTTTDYDGKEWVDKNVTILPAITFTVPEGRSSKCHSLTVPANDHGSGTLFLSGTVGGRPVQQSRRISLRTMWNQTFIQTDRYLYQYGETVQFRVLQINGADLDVSREAYEEVWVNNPSRNRIAQWRNVNNSAGLVHLNFTLADEPEEGTYTINVRDSGGSIHNQNFKVEEYVLPRYEVTLTPPPYALANEDAFTFKMCANYTFGQPLKGNLTFSLTNGERKRCFRNITRTANFTGCEEFSVTSAELRIIDCSVNYLRASVVVEEEGTGVSMAARASVSVRRTAVTFNTLYEDDYKKPNLPYSLKVRAELPDGSAASGVAVEVCAGGQCKNMTTAPNGLFTAVVSSPDTNRVFMSTLNCRADMRSSSFDRELKHYYSPSNSSLLIVAPEGQVKCAPGQSSSHALPVMFSAVNQSSALVNVQVVSRGKVMDQRVQDVELVSGRLPVEEGQMVDAAPALPPGTVTGLMMLPLDIPHTAAPKLKVLVWYTRDDGEVVSDVRELKVEKCLGYNTNFTWDQARVQPGEQATLSLAAEPNSVCSVGVIDKSTELLNVDPDPITLETVFDYISNFDIQSWVNSQVDDNEYCREKARGAVFPVEEENLENADGPVDVTPIRPPPPRRGYYYSDYVDALQMFDDSGVYVITDFTVETRPCEFEENNYYDYDYDYDYDRPFASTRPPPQASFGISADIGGGGGGFAAAAPTPQSGAEEKTEPEESGESAPRTDFPETWLWDIVAIPESGVNEQTVTLPDTITQWVGRAVCAHPQKGFGLSSKSAITTFTPFFTDLTLPPSVKRGEILPVKVSVFNYLNQKLPVRVELRESPEYEIVAAAGQDAADPATAAYCINDQDKKVHTFRIQPAALGDVNITVVAYVDDSAVADCGNAANVVKRDEMVRPIKVDAEGFPREETWTKYVCAEEVAAGQDTLDTWEVSHRPDIVPDSARGWVTAVGDLLALTLENLGHLIRLPYGCGEQNMVNFAPNIYIHQYLSTSRQLTRESEDKLLRNMRTGYQRELLYRRSNGSYSAFGNADESGSTWLTAFVLKSFNAAKDIITVDEASLNQTREWLEQNPRDPAGCIVPVGKLFNKGLKGGLTGKSPVPMTAYILAAMLEGGNRNQFNATMVKDTLRCVTEDTSVEPYTLALKAYALTLAEDPKAGEVLQKLLEVAVTEDNALYWKQDQGAYRSNALAVETAGYAVLALLRADPEANLLTARRAIKWITANRNGQGGFYSTQDTVIGLQALAAYASTTYQGPVDVTATVSAPQGSFSHTFLVNDDNKMLFQLQNLPAIPASVSVDVQGQGCAVMQAVLRYNIPEPEPSDAFSLTVTATDEPGRPCTKRLRACSSYLLEDGESNMAVIEANLISGFIPEKEDLKRTVRENRGVIKRYEVDGTKVSFYIEEFVRGQEVCVNFRMYREVEVEAAKPGTVLVYDYYQPEFSFSQNYNFPSLEECRK